MLGVGVAGCGFFGGQLARAVARTTGARLVALVDAAPEVAGALAVEVRR